jgi:hypothetical protein
MKQAVKGILTVVNAGTSESMFAVTAAAVDIGSEVDVLSPLPATGSSILVGPLVSSAGLGDGCPTARAESVTRHRAAVLTCLILVAKPFLQQNSGFRYLASFLHSWMLEAYICRIRSRCAQNGIISGVDLQINL